MQSGQKRPIRLQYGTAQPRGAAAKMRSAEHRRTEFKKRPLQGYFSRSRHHNVPNNPPPWQKQFLWQEFVLSMREVISLTSLPNLRGKSPTPLRGPLSKWKSPDPLISTFHEEYGGRGVGGWRTGGREDGFGTQSALSTGKNKDKHTAVDLYPRGGGHTASTALPQAAIIFQVLIIHSKFHELTVSTILG